MMNFSQHIKSTLLTVTVALPVVVVVVVVVVVAFLFNIPLCKSLQIDSQQIDSQQLDSQKINSLKNTNQKITTNSKRPLSAKRFNELSGMGEKESLQEIWDKKYGSNIYVYGKGPADFLRENVHYLPPSAKVLDVGMGEGRNAVFLAQKGLDVTGIDISSVAIKKSLNLAQEYGVKIKGVATSFKYYQVKDNEFDAIICFYFVDRELNKKLLKWLKPGGIIIFESYTINQLTVADFDSNSYGAQDFLKPQELLHLFPGMITLKYDEPLHKKEFLSSIILKKPGKQDIKEKFSKNPRNIGHTNYNALF
ncbi:MAG: methyltransferase domain-containing protein [Oligoflexia bacterium]|nr:methyltransferase domain-containing protein [Oligoflexia bacterium]